MVHLAGGFTSAASCPSFAVSTDFRNWILRGDLDLAISVFFKIKVETVVYMC